MFLFEKNYSPLVSQITDTVPPDTEYLGVRSSCLPGVGLGLVALKEFRKDCVVGTYKGVYQSVEEFNRTETDDSYSMRLSRSTILNAGGNISSFTKYINTLQGSQVQIFGGFNCTFKHCRSTNKVTVVTTKPVKKNCEFFIDYNM